MCTLKHTYSEVPIYCTNSSNSHRQRRKIKEKKKRGCGGGGGPVVNKEAQQQKTEVSINVTHIVPRIFTTTVLFRERSTRKQVANTLTHVWNLQHFRKRQNITWSGAEVGEKTCTQNQAVLNKDLICKRVHSVHYRHWKGEEERNGRACNTSKKDYTYICITKWRL